MISVFSSIVLLLLIVSFTFLLFQRRERRVRRALEIRVRELNQALREGRGRFEEQKLRLETTFAGMGEGVS